MLCLYEKIKLLSRLCFLIYTLNSNFMSNVVFWRQVFLGALYSFAADIPSSLRKLAI